MTHDGTHGPPALHLAARLIQRNDGLLFFFFSSRRRHTRFDCDWSSDVCFPILWACTKSTIRFQADTCSGLYMPVQPGEIRPSGDTSVISVNTSPAPPMALAPRCTR